VIVFAKSQNRHSEKMLNILPKFFLSLVDFVVVVVVFVEKDKDRCKSLCT